MLESMNYSIRNAKKHNLSNLPHQTVEKLQTKNHGVLRGPQLDKQRWRARLGILRVNVVFLSYIRQIHITSLSFLLTGVSWNFTGRKKKYSGSAYTNIHDHTHITLLIENPIPNYNHQICNYWTATSAHYVALVLSEPTSAYDWTVMYDGLLPTSA